MQTVEDILMAKGPDVIVASPGTTVLEAVRLMAEAKVGSLIVKDDDGVAGIFTERDLLSRVVARSLEPGATMLADVMSSPVESVRLTTTVDDVGFAMSRSHIRHLVVMEDGALIGVVGLRDVLAAQLREDERQLHELQDQD